MFDLYRIFIGDSHVMHLAEIIFRTSFMYLYTILNVRLMDKRSLGLLSSYEMIIIIALGTSVGDPMFYTNVPLIQGMFVISTIVLMERFISFLSEKNKNVALLIEGKPVLIIKKGKEIKDAMQKQRISPDELLSALRTKGIKDVSQVEAAYLEPSGAISVIRFDLI